VKRQTRAMPMFGFILGMVLACYVGFSRLNHRRFLQREPMLPGILRVARLPPQCTFWRFLASLHLGAARQLLSKIYKIEPARVIPVEIGPARRNNDAFSEVMVTTRTDLFFSDGRRSLKVKFLHVSLI
jgi:hypothetical protein